MFVITGYGTMKATKHSQSDNQTMQHVQLSNIKVTLYTIFVLDMLHCMFTGDR